MPKSMAMEYVTPSLSPVPPHPLIFLIKNIGVWMDTRPAGDARDAHAHARLWFYR